MDLLSPKVRSTPNDPAPTCPQCPATLSRAVREHRPIHDERDDRVRTKASHVPSCPTYAAGDFSRCQPPRVLRAAGTGPPRPFLGRWDARSMRASTPEHRIALRLYGLEDFLVVPGRKEVGHCIRPFERQATPRELINGVAHEGRLRPGGFNARAKQPRPKSRTSIHDILLVSCHSTIFSSVREHSSSSRRAEISWLLNRSK